MKLIRARIDGFRLLNELEIEFSTDDEKNITVVRAANESGKTTLLTALQWGLIGDKALPNGYKLRPMGRENGEVVETKIEIEYAITNRDGRNRFRLIRSVQTVDDEKSAPKSNLTLFHINSSGYESLSSPVNHLQQHFPSELREVFFTDGDRALSFIEGPTSEQQHKVRGAIERMMGLSLLETTIEHIKTHEKRLRGKFEKEAGNAETKSVEDELADIDKVLPSLEKQFGQCQEEIAGLSEKHQKAETDLEQALKQGNRTELANDLRSTQTQRRRLEGEKKKTEQKQSELVASQLLTQHLLSAPLKKAGALLDDLREKGLIPFKTIPVLEDRLNHSDCICGESLDADTDDGFRRRQNIESLIAQSKQSDRIKGKISDLYFNGETLFKGEPTSWKDTYASALKERSSINSILSEVGTREAELDAKLKQIPDIDIQRLKEIKEIYSNKLSDLNMRSGQLAEQIRQNKKEKVILEKKYQSLSAKVAKGKKVVNEMCVASDMRRVVERALNRMKTEEIALVSDTMNNLFLRMIGADEESALITRAEITSEFRIVVYGRDERQIDPSMDLNGASRRALTVAFVLALTEVSGVDAPNVIDTPLGMMSGYVKSEVVRTASQNSAQLILLLTHDEIKGCEEILDDRSAKGVTMTNPAHYPKILKNDPGTKEVKVLTCNCDHRSVCNVCDRYENATDASMEAV